MASLLAMFEQVKEYVLGEHERQVGTVHVESFMEAMRSYYSLCDRLRQEQCRQLHHRQQHIFNPQAPAFIPRQFRALGAQGQWRNKA